LARTTNPSEVRRYFHNWVDSAFQNNFIDRHKREQSVRALENHLSGLVKDLNCSGQAILDLGAGAPDLKIFLREGRDPSSGSGFSLFEIQWPGKEHHRKLRCFVGNRFLPEIANSLRMNLRHVLEPSNIELVWSGMDMIGVSLLDDIVEKIAGCDFCIFDNRLTARRPNVYIEVGIAYALSKPFILANYKGDRNGIPSDLKQILNINYKSYKDLCSTLHYNLPAFLRTVGLRKPLAPPLESSLRKVVNKGR
jgi:hypothetical protein